MPEHTQARSLFPLFFISGWLLAFYQRALKGKRRDRGALPLLLRSWWLGPRAIPLGGAQRSGPHAYTVTLDEDFCSDEMGHTTLLLLEDGKPLPLPHATSIKKIASHGQGRWVHVGRKLIFSPSDNADLASKPHQYHLIDGLGGNPALFGPLSKLAQLRSTFRNPAAYALAKLQLVLAKRLSVGRQREVDDRNLLVESLGLDLSAVFLPDLSVGRLALEVLPAGGAHRVQADLRDVTWGGLRLDELKLTLEIENYQPRLTALAAHRDGVNLVRLATHPAEGPWQSARVDVAGLAALRKELAAACGGMEAAAAWLESWMADLASGALPMGLEIAEADRAILGRALAADGQADTLTLELTRAGHSILVSARIP